MRDLAEIKSIADHHNCAEHQFLYAKLISKNFNIDEITGEAKEAQVTCEVTLAYLKKSAIQNYPDAQYQLGKHYHRFHQPTEENKYHPIQYLIAAGKNGHPTAALKAGDHFSGKKNFKVAMGYYLLATQYGNLLACKKIAVAYETGEGVEKDLVQADQWKRRFCEESFKLGNALDKVDEFNSSFTHYRAAAKLGHRPSQAKVAEAYTQGKGIEKDLLKAAKWYNQCGSRFFGGKLPKFVLAYNALRDEKSSQGMTRK